MDATRAGRDAFVDSVALDAGVNVNATIDNSTVVDNTVANSSIGSSSVASTPAVVVNAADAFSGSDNVVNTTIYDLGTNDRGTKDIAVVPLTQKTLGDASQQGLETGVQDVTLITSRPVRTIINKPVFGTTAATSGTVATASTPATQLTPISSYTKWILLAAVAYIILKRKR